MCQNVFANVTQFNDLKTEANGVVAIYGRVALNENNALEAQITDLINHANLRGDNNHIIYQEIGSGSLVDRFEMNRMLKDAKSGKFKRLYIENIARISRDMVTAAKVFDTITSSGIEIVVINNG